MFPRETCTKKLPYGQRYKCAEIPTCKPLADYWKQLRGQK